MTQGTTWKHCTRLGNLVDILNDKSLNLEHLEAVLINCGVNDLDYSPASVVHSDIVKNIRILQAKFPHIKVILNEITPRKDRKDSEVMECNDMLRESLNHLENVILINLDNLRNANGTHLHDTKHIKKISIPLFAANMKSGLRKAFNIRKPFPSANNWEDVNVNRYPPNISNNPKDHQLHERLKNIAGYDNTFNSQAIVNIIESLKRLIR